MNTKTSIYWIHLPTHTDFNTQGYIGVSKRLQKRITEHYSCLLANSHPNPHLSNAFKKYGLDSLVCETLFVGDEDFCYKIESEWRPHSNIGWNISPGGHRGPGAPIGRKVSAESLAKAARTREINKDQRIAKKKAREDAKNKLLVEAKRAKSEAKLKEIEKVKQAKAEAKRAKSEAKLKEIEKVKQAKAEAKEQSLLRKLCPVCQCKPVSVNYIYNNRTYYRKTCEQCADKKAKIKPRPHAWVKSGYKKKPHCEKCGFIAKHLDQLQVFHLDGNLKNTNWINLKTICANCAIEVYKSKLPWKPSSPEA